MTRAAAGSWPRWSRSGSSTPTLRPPGGERGRPRPDDRRGSQLIRGAAILAIADGSEQITRDLLEAVPVDYAAERGATARPAAGRSRSVQREAG